MGHRMLELAESLLSWSCGTIVVIWISIGTLAKIGASGTHCTQYYDSIVFPHSGWFGRL